MKRISLILAFVIFALSLTGCLGAGASDNTSDMDARTEAVIGDDESAEKEASPETEADTAQTDAERGDTTSEKTEDAEAADETVSPETEAAEPETKERETTKQETTKQETTKQETTKQETTKQETIKQETTKQETTKQETTKQETTKQETTSPAVTEPTGNDYASEVLRLVNEIRRQYGLSELTLDPELCHVAQLKSEDMHDKGYFDHTSPTYGTPFEMMKKFGITYRAAGENIAKGYRTPAAVVDGWMNSEGHRANILNASYTKMGIGYVADGHYWTQMFTG